LGDENTTHHQRGVELHRHRLHNRYSVFCVFGTRGAVLESGRIDHLCPQQFVALVRRWPGRRVVFEACMNWHWLFEILEGAMPREDFVLANPFKPRGADQDHKIDARILADLLGGNLMSSVHICGKEGSGVSVHVISFCRSKRPYPSRCNRMHTDPSVFL
jgi:hypothetical protein